MTDLIKGTRVQGGNVSLLQDDQGYFIRWRHPDAGSVIERLDPEGIVQLRTFLNEIHAVI